MRRGFRLVMIDQNSLKMILLYNASVVAVASNDEGYVIVKDINDSRVRRVKTLDNILMSIPTDIEDPLIFIVNPKEDTSNEFSKKKLIQRYYDFLEEEGNGQKGN